MDICILGDDPFGPALYEAARGQSVDGRPIAPRRLRSLGPDDRCAVVYVGRSRDPTPAETLRALKGAPVLTVTDEGQEVSGGMIHFVSVEGRVRFIIDLGQAQASGLTLSSKLLALAVTVEKGE